MLYEVITDKISKLGDFIRLSFCDKYFKPIGCQTKTGAGGKGYESAHYLSYNFV